MLAGSNHGGVERYPRTRPLADLNPTPFEATPEYLGTMAATWQDGPSSGGRTRVVAPIAVMAVVVAVIGVCVAVVGHHSAKPVTNADLLRLVHSSSDALDREPSNSFTMSEKVSGHGFSETIDTAGVSSAREQESAFRMTANGVAETGMQLKNLAYLKIPRLNAFLNTGKDWLAIRSPKPTAVEQQLQASGPAALLSGLATVRGTVDNEGTAALDGVETTKYRFHVDALKLFGSTFAKLLGPGANATLKQEGFANLPMTLWLDGQGLPRELELDMHVDGLTVHEVGYMKPSARALDLTAPPASDVHMVGSLSDFGRLLRAMTAESTPDA